MRPDEKGYLQKFLETMCLAFCPEDVACDPPDSIIRTRGLSIGIEVTGYHDPTPCNWGASAPHTKHQVEAAMEALLNRIKEERRTRDGFIAGWFFSWKDMVLPSGRELGPFLQELASVWQANISSATIYEEQEPVNDQRAERHA